MRIRPLELWTLLVVIAFFCVSPAEAYAQGGEAAKSSLIGYVILVLGLLLGWTPLIRPSRRKKKFAFET
jgi:hypothetical protein